MRTKEEIMQEVMVSNGDDKSMDMIFAEIRLDMRDSVAAIAGSIATVANNTNYIAGHLQAMGNLPAIADSLASVPAIANSIIGMNSALADASGSLHRLTEAEAGKEAERPNPGAFARMLAFGRFVAGLRLPWTLRIERRKKD